jgi:hypothetical protein
MSAKVAEGGIATIHWRKDSSDNHQPPPTPTRLSHNLSLKLITYTIHCFLVPSRAEERLDNIGFPIERKAKEVTGVGCTNGCYCN